MKNLLALFVFSLLSFQQSAAQNIAYEVIRTQEAPGYFALRVYPGSDLPELEVETVFVENFDSTAERKKFTNLSQSLKNTGLSLLSSTQATELVGSDKHRLVLLGGPVQNRWLQFAPQDYTGLSEQFEMFSLTKLGPVYLSNINAEFGGNVSQVRPDQVPFLDDQSTYFVGQFDKEMKTRVSLSGETPELTVQADGIMDLTTYKPHQADSMLENLWKELTPTNAATIVNPSLWNLKSIVTSSFPFLLGFIGLLLMYLAAKPSKLKTGMIAQMDDIFWHTPIEETPLYQAWEENFPWELTDKELKLTQVAN